MAIVATFAIFHGFSHGAEMPEDSSGFMFASGFIGATTLLPCSGIALGLGIARLSSAVSQLWLKIGGGATALVLLSLVSGVI